MQLLVVAEFRWLISRVQLSFHPLSVNVLGIDDGTRNGRRIQLFNSLVSVDNPVDMNG